MGKEKKKDSCCKGYKKGKMCRNCPLRGTDADPKAKGGKKKTKKHKKK